MLIRYKKNFEKIAMGLLSFMPAEKDVKKLQETIKEYETNPNWHLYLWKEDDILAAIGVKIENEEKAILQHITVNPSYRNCGIGKKMVHEIHNMYKDKYTVCPDEVTKQFYDKCDQDYPTNEE